MSFSHRILSQYEKGKRGRGYNRKDEFMEEKETKHKIGKKRPSSSLWKRLENEKLKGGQYGRSSSQEEKEKKRVKRD